MCTSNAYTRSLWRVASACKTPVRGGSRQRAWSVARQLAGNDPTKVEFCRCWLSAIMTPMLNSSDSHVAVGDTLPRTLAVIEQGRVAGWHVGFQLYVSRGGEVLADVGLGDARPGVSMRSNTLMLWFSAGKPLAAVAIAQLWERGRVDLDDPVCAYIPEFGGHGKATVTLRHLLTHTGGFLRDWHWAEYAGARKYLQQYDLSRLRCWGRSASRLTRGRGLVPRGDRRQPRG